MTFVVFKSVRGEATLEYLGNNIDEAVTAYKSNPGSDNIEVWKNGKYIDIIYDKSDFISKFVSKKTS